MKSVRLTQDMRQKIQHRLLEPAFGKPSAQLLKDFVADGPAAVTALALPIKSLNEQLGLLPAEVVTKSPVDEKKVRKVKLSSLYGKFGSSGGTDDRD